MSRTNAGSVRARLAAEALEDRAVPAGTVTITAVQGPDTLSAAVPVATEGALASPSINGTFTDTNAVTPANLTVTVDYGDGTPISSNQAGPNFDPNLLVTQVGGAGGTTYTVTDNHTFPEESGSTVPPFAFTVTLKATENANAANTDTRTATAQVLDAALSPGDPVKAVSAGVTTGGNTGNATTAAQALAKFEAAIGGPKNTAASPQPNGFRTITWDGVKVDGTDSAAGPNSTTVITQGHTVGIPLDRFQGQGVFFGAVYAVSNDGFVDVNPNVGAPNPPLFPAFSTPNTFAMFNDNGIDFKFVAPSATNTALASAASRGFGSIFLNVQQPGTTIQYFHGSTLLDTVNVPTNATPGAAVFAGELFTQPIVTNVLLTLGDGVIFKFDGTTVQSGGANTAANNLVAVDDWAFAEPVPVANGFSIVSGPAGTGGAPPLATATAGQPFSGVVATFSDTDPNGDAKDYTATINWGDGHLTNGTIAADANKGFTVSGTNTYAAAGTFPVSVDIADFGGGPGIGGSQPTVSVINTIAVTAPPPPPVALARVLAVSGAATGTASLYAPSASGQYSNPPTATTPANLFGGFTGEVRAATGDFNGDGVEDTVLVTGPGTPTRMAVVSGKDGSILLTPTDPFGDANFTFGGFVTAGDIDRDGKSEWVVTPDLRGGPRVVIFGLNADGSTKLVANFFGIQDDSFRDGARAALGDVNGDGILDVFCIAAFNGGPRTALFDGKDVLIANSQGRAPNKLVGDFFATTSGQDEGRGGRTIAVGDVNGDGVADLIVSGDNLLGTGNRVTIFSGADLIAGRPPGGGAAVLADFAVGGQPGGALVSLAAVNADADNRADLAVGSGAGQESLVKVYLGKNLSGTSEPASTPFDPFGSVTPSGVFVG
jgi:hypothetical protein